MQLLFPLLLQILLLDVKFVIPKLEEVLVLVLEVLLILNLILEAAHFVEDVVVCRYFLWVELLVQHLD